MATRQEPPSPEQSQLRERPFGELLKQLSEETTRLVHQEIELAKAELTQKGRQAGLGAGLFGAAGAIGFLALAALIVAVVYAVVAAVLAMRGRAKVRQAVPPVPEQTIETVKEDVQWAKTQMRSDKTSNTPGPR